MTRITRSRAPQLAGVAVAFAFGAHSPAHAFQFKNESGELTGSFDTTISFGTTWRMQGRDPSLIGITNGGTARSVNEDDGNLNYNKNDRVSSVLKASHDLELKYRNFGAFVRAFYFYDFVNADKTGLGPLAHERIGRDFQVRDAYVRGDFELGGRRLNLRVGNQVVSWGESTFIQNGINVINPVDAGKLRVPGAELKEGLIASPMLWASQELSDNASVEAFVLTNFDKTKIDPRGSFLSSNDFLSDDGDKVFVGFGRRKDLNSPLTSPLADPAAAVWAPRSADREAKDSGQYGIAFRYLLPDWNNTELGLYHINYHSRTPIASGIKGSTSSSLATGTARYFAEYPENIRLFGVSVSTSAPFGIALQGEYSYRPNQPLQVAAPELLLTALGVPSQIAANPATVAAGSEVSGYRRVKMHQVQMTATKLFGPSIGAEQFTLLGEVGYNRLQLPDGLGFNASGVFLPALPLSATLASSGSTQNDGYMTKNSWGYRLAARLDYPNAIGAATASPRLAFSHDVDGTGPNFNKGLKALTLGVGFNYQQKWQADVAYTAFFGGRAYSGTDPLPVPAGQSASYSSSANPLKDRDFLAVSVSYSF